jgi:putative phosphoesterase
MLAVNIVIIGILSDSHDRAEVMAAGLRLLADAHAEFYIHCGDIGSPRCIDLLAGLESAFVFGNTDYDRAALTRYSERIGVQCYGNYADLTQDGKRIAVVHGDDFKLKQRLLAAQEHDYLFQGHTHVRQDQRIGRTRLINPGALHRAAVKTVATLDTATDRLNFITVNL